MALRGPNGERCSHVPRTQPNSQAQAGTAHTWPLHVPRPQPIPEVCTAGERTRMEHSPGSVVAYARHRAGHTRDAPSRRAPFLRLACAGRRAGRRERRAGRQGGADVARRARHPAPCTWTGGGAPTVRPDTCAMSKSDRWSVVRTTPARPRIGADPGARPESEVRGTRFSLMRAEHVEQSFSLTSSKFAERSSTSGVLRAECHERSSTSGVRRAEYEDRNCHAHCLLRPVTLHSAHGQENEDSRQAHEGTGGEAEDEAHRTASR